MARAGKGPIIVGLSAITLLALAHTLPAEAQGRAAARARYDAAFDAMMADLGNPDRSLAFVEAAVASGDLRGAIAALERILLLRPNLANIKFELGFLYREAGAPETAAVYLEEARASGQVPPEYEARLEQAIEDAKAERATHRLTASFSVAGRYETNANAAPDSEGITGIGDLNEADQERDDFSLATSADLEHRWDLGRQLGDELISELSLYDAEYREVDESDLILLQGRSGPRFYLGDPEQPTALRPFLEASALWLSDEFYRGSLGAGLSASRDLTERLRGDVTVRGGWQDFDNSDANPSAGDRTGPFLALNSGVGIDLSRSLYLDLRGLVNRRDADEEFESYWEIGPQATLSYYFQGLTGGRGEPWTVSASAGFSYSVYDEEDPTLDDEEQRDKRFDLGLTLEAPLGKGWSLVAETDYTRNASNYETEEYDNLLVSLGVAYRLPLLP